MKNNRVLIFNSECQSKIDNNTYPPATQNLQTGVITFDTTHWIVVSDGRNTIGLAEHVQDTSNPHNVTKSQVGLGNVENKSSSDIRGELTSANVTSALGYTPMNQNEKGAINGVATLGADGKVPSSQLPSYVDDIVELNAMSTTAPATCAKGDWYFNTSDSKLYKATAANTWGVTAYNPEKSKIYFNKADEKYYRWGGSAMREVLSSEVSGIKVGSSGSTLTPANGVVTIPAYEEGAQVNTITGVKGDSETDYRTGDVNITPANIGLGNVVNTGDSDTPVSGGTTKFTTGGAYTELAKKADIDNDGHVPAEQLENDYPDLTAGNIVGEFTQQAEFGYRPSAGTVDVKSGYKVDHGGKVMGVKGNTVAWNQIVKNGDFSDGDNDWYFDGTGSVSGGVATITGSGTSYMGLYQECISPINGHKYYYSCRVKCTAAGSFRAYFGVSHVQNLAILTLEVDKWTNVSTITTMYVNTEGYLQQGIIANGALFVTNILVFDLTLIYGAGNEPETAEEFEEDYFKWYGKPLSYEAYDEGSLRSVKMTGLKTVGFNQYNNGTAKVIGGLEYQITGSFTALSLEGETVTPDNDGYFTPATTGTLTVTGGDADTCVHLVHSGERNGEYEPYWESQMDFDVTKVYGKLNGEGSLVQVFPDGMRGIGTIQDSIDLVNRKCYIKCKNVELSTLSWYKEEGWTMMICNVADKKPSTNLIKCSSYAYTANTSFAIPDRCISDSAVVNYLKIIFICNNDWSSMTTEAAKATLEGVYATYQLEEPLHYTDCVYRDNGVDTPLDQMGEYDVDDWGTEEVLLGTNGVAPVLDLKYGLNAADTLKNLPNSYVSVNVQTLTSDQQERVKRNLGLTNPSSIGIDSEVQTITANTSVTIPTGNWASKTIVFVNGGSSALTVTVPTSGVQTPDGQAIELTCPVGGYCEVSLLKIGSTIYARGI